MIPQPGGRIERLMTDRKHIQQLMREINQQIGLEHDPMATAEKAREMILADGVKPEDNLFSCGIIAARDEE
jgi:hypothetical protein